MKSLDLQILEALSLAANNLAQNKIGSGFDVKTAIHGSQIFCRYADSVMASIEQQAWDKIDALRVQNAFAYRSDWRIALPQFM